MSLTLLETLGLKIENSSKTRFIIANGERKASLGKTQIEIEIDEWIIQTTVEIMDSKQKEILLGTQFLAEMDGKIDLENKILTFKIENENISIPIYYTRKEMIQTSDESSDSEYTDEYDEYEEIEDEYDINELDNEIQENEQQLKDNDAKLKVLAKSVERR
jgi:hypothetical protein